MDLFIRHMFIEYLLEAKHNHRYLKNGSIPKLCIFLPVIETILALREKQAQ